MLVCCTSDLHGSLPEIPDCDLLLIGGDLCAPYKPLAQYNWLATEFRDWAIDLVERDIKIVGVEGNHGILAGFHPELFKDVSTIIPWTYLQDTYAEFKDKVIYGTPDSLPFGSIWAFNVPENELEKKFNNIHESVDIIISHGPPYGIGDVPGFVPKRHTGSVSLLETINRIRPKILVCGHIHGSYGVYEYENYDGTVTKIINASHMDEEYRPVNKPILVEI